MVNSLVGQHDKETAVERKKRTHKTKRKHHTETRKDSHKSRTREWDDIIEKLLSKVKEKLKKDKKLYGSYIDKNSATKSKGKSDKKKDRSKNRDEHTASASNKKFHDQVGDKTKTTQNKASDKSDSSKNKNEQTTSASNKKFHDKVGDKTKTTQNKASDKSDSSKNKDEQTTSASNKKFHDKVGDKTKTTQNKASDKSDSSKNKDEQTTSASNKKFHDKVGDKTKTTQNKASDKSDSNKNKNEQTTSASNKKMHDKVGDETKTPKKASDKSDKGKDHHKNSDEESVSKFLNETKLVSLREALLVHPFSTWKFKDRFNSMADLGVHEALLYDVVKNKWNTRLKHKLFKALRGENIHLAVIGGSNTAGGGIQKDEGRTDGLFFRVILDWWQKTITPITGSHLKTRQIAMGGTSSDFFQYCHRSYVQKDVDLVLLEMSVNDLHELPYHVNLSLPIEQLTRQLLEYPTEPALLYVNLLSGRSYYQGCTNLEDFGQQLLSNMYEITTFNWRDAVCPVIDGKYRIPLKGCSVVCKDGHHINQLGHAHISLMVINLFRDLLLDNIGHVDELSEQVFHDEVVLPKPVFIAEQSKIITDPVCWTTVTPNFKKKIITNSMEVGVMENYGFDFIHDKAIGGGYCFTENACRADAYSGWTGRDVGASLTLSFTVPPLGHKRRIQSRSVVFATRTCWKCGVAEVWLDDDVVNRRHVRAQSQYSQTLLAIVSLRVNPGDHTMSVKVVHPGSVTVVGVMLGPPDGPY
jgi:hypothetical protein